MASGESANLVTEFEQAYAEALATLCEEDTIHDKTTIESHKISRFTDLARQLEMFFLQKRFLIYAHKPELIMKEDSLDLKAELQKKDELIRRHYEKLAQWQSLLQEVQGGGTNQTPSSSSISGQPVAGTAGPMAAGPSSGAKLQPGSPMQHSTSFVPGNNYRMNPQPSQTPLAYLEKTTSNISR